MAKKPKIVGYGICGPNEKRLEQTLKEFDRLCDETVILFNNADEDSKNLVKSYGFHTAQDDSEWGKWQWKIKEKFITNIVRRYKPDLCVALDMDEVFDKNLTKESLYGLYSTEFPAFYFYIVNLWDEGYNPDRNFWNIRVWKWSDELGTSFPRKNVHCGLAPEWVWARGMYVPYILKHYGLKDKEDRDKKTKRYEQYDPKARFITKEYYDSLKSFPHIEPFNEDKLHLEVVEYVNKYKQKYIKPMEKEEDLIIMKRKDNGEEITVDRKQQRSYEKQGFEFVNDYSEVKRVVEETVKTLTQEINTTNEPEESFRCGQCGKEFSSSKGLHGHKMGAHKTTYKWKR